jgi:CheY-like chemotaxis protein/anti-sigma regulatory factor (Ser/Thr protein kinase)
MSHELRTPLNSILSRTEALTEGIYDPLSERQLRTVAVIARSGQHLLELINDVLDLSRIEAGKLTPALAAVDAPAACRASLELVAGQARARGLHVSLEVDPAVRTVQADERQLKQVLVNLLSNAVKFTPNDGRIGLELRGDDDAGRALFIVWDSGIGIAPADLERLFQPFTQLDSGLNRQYEGAGLGLALVRRLVDLHHGGVSVASTPGQGSRFTVWLPWTPEAAAPASEVADATAGPVGPAARPAALLLAEDNPATQQAYSAYLSALGYAIHTAASGAETIAQARRLRPDLIVMDVQLPGMDGLEAMRFLRADPALASVPIIAVTALAMPGDRERCLAAGATEYLTKPISLKFLSQTIAALLHGTAQPDAA